MNNSICWLLHMVAVSASRAKKEKYVYVYVNECAEHPNQSQHLFFNTFCIEFAAAERKRGEKLKKMTFTYPVVNICLTCKHHFD